jgi:(hydroxyamino)benzene mutase
VDDRARRLAWHGVALVLAGLLMGTVVMSVTTPRLGLAAHTGTIMNGLLVIAIAAVWAHVRLSPRAGSIAFWLVADGGWLNGASLFLAGVWGTSRTTPIAGAGHEGTAWQEALVGAGLTIGAAATLAGVGMVLWGLGRRRG